jgi:hypothetical protein
MNKEQRRRQVFQEVYKEGLGARISNPDSSPALGPAAMQRTLMSRT